MIVGIVLFAFAMKIVVGHVGDELDTVAAFALCGGSALYLLTYSAIRTRVERKFHVSRGRFTAALLLLALLPVATIVPALAALALVAAVWIGFTPTSSSGGARPARNRAPCSPLPKRRCALSVDGRAQPRSKPRCVVGGRGEIPGVGRRPKRSDARVHLGARGGLERLDESVPDPFEHGDVSGDPVEILRGRVDTKLLRPQVEARRVDLGGGTVPKLKIGDGLREIERLLLRAGRVVGDGVGTRRPQVRRRPSRLCRSLSRTRGARGRARAASASR